MRSGPSGRRRAKPSCATARRSVGTCPHRSLGSRRPRSRSSSSRSSGRPSCSPTTARAAAAGRIRSRSRAAPMLPVQVIGQQWEFTYRYPTYGGVETAELVLPGRPGDRVPCHLARCGPLVLGVRARRQGGREPRRRQRRLREAGEARHLPDPLRRALRALARLHVRHRAASSVLRTSRRGSQRSARSSPAFRSTCRSTARPTHPTRSSAPDERAPSDRVQPADGDRARPSSASTPAGGSGTRSPGRASRTSATPTRTTSRSSSPISSG